MKKYLTRYKKIAIAGMARSGKTVFLTSLINHILEHQSEDFRLEPNDVKIVKTRVLSKDDPDHFQYHRYREDLVRSGGGIRCLANENNGYFAIQNSV